MDETLLKRAYLAAAAVAGGLLASAGVYLAVVELLAARGYRAPLAAPAGYGLKYALYGVAVSALPVIRLASARLGGSKDSALAQLRALTALSVVKSAAAELPAAAGLLLYLLGGFRQDFYLLTLFSAALQLYHFPRLAAWRERLREHGGL
ncbi:MAG: hypothetical protein M0025_10635 [Elusimicrobia bacterium]|nr:hypothetical protein [Elusimicrobiota bacterium]